MDTQTQQQGYEFCLGEMWLVIRYYTQQEWCFEFLVIDFEQIATETESLITNFHRISPATAGLGITSKRWTSVVFLFLVFDVQGTCYLIVGCISLPRGLELPIVCLRFGVFQADTSWELSNFGAAFQYNGTLILSNVNSGLINHGLLFVGVPSK